MPPNATISDEDKLGASFQTVSEQVQRVLKSETFKSSEILRHLLEYLSICSLNGRTESVKVKEIARDVFGRSENFDSQTDSVVRVHTGRLRSKLAEYYLDEGADDELIVGIPKGSYGLTWHPRRSPSTSVVPAPAENAAVLAIPESITPSGGHPDHRAKLAFAGAVLVLIVTTAAAGFWPKAKPAAGSSILASGPSLATFWHPFVSPREQPLIVFSTFRLGGSLDTEVRPLPANISSPEEIDTYTTIGEVMGVFEVSRMLAAFGQGARAKHGRLLTWDEAKDSNLIFVGGPLAQTPLRSLPPLGELQFRKGLPGLPPTTAAIVDVHPRPKEQAVYPGPVTRPFRFDYGVIAIKPTFNPNRRALILAGITEFGTQGAADFVTQEDKVAELLARLHVKPGSPMPCFEALVRVNIETDVPVQYELVFVRPTK
jgi:hypothetical protein